MENPLITIGITAYNSETTIQRAVDSALAQTWKSLEIIIVNDASTDCTRSILEKLAAEHSSIHLISMTCNQGVAVARNKIVQAANGEFLAFFDDDDESVPHRIERQYERIIAYEQRWETDLIICHSARLQYWPDGTRRIEPTMGCDEQIQAPAGLRVAERILIGRPYKNAFGACATCSQMARLSVYRRLGGFSEHLRRGEDTELNIRLARAGAHFVGIDEPLVIQYINLSHDKSLAIERYNQLALLETSRDFLEKILWYEFCRSWLDIKYDYFSRNYFLSLGKALKLFLLSPVKFVKRFIWVFPNLKFNFTTHNLYKENL